MNSNFILFSIIKIVCVFLPLMGMVAYAVLAERKIAAMMGEGRGACPAAMPVSGYRISKPLSPPRFFH